MRRSESAGKAKSLLKPMEYRTLGQTQLQVSVLGFGASPLGDVFGVTDPKEGHRAVHLAIDEGINLFDVSPYYGLTLAEERLGTALTGRRHEVVLATKCGRYGLDVFDFSAIRIQQSIDESLRRLRTDYVDLYQVHDVEFGDIEQIIEETIPTMRRIQEAGKARYIGITGYPLSVLMRIAARIPVDTILSYCRYNLLVDDLGRELIPFAEQSGIGIINASALHMGLLADGDPPDWHPAPRIIRSAARQAANFCRAHGSNISEIALRFSLDSPHVASTLVGMCTVEQVRSSLWALGGPADADMTQQVRNILAPALNYVWPSGRPENHEPNC